MEGTIISFSSLDTWVATVIRFLLEREKCRGHCQKEEDDEYVGAVETGTKE